MKYDRKNLVALLLDPLTAYPYITDLNHDNFLETKVVVNEELGTWSYTKLPVLIGEHLVGKGLVIGVYDGSDMGHINRMLHLAKDLSNYDHKDLFGSLK